LPIVTLRTKAKGATYVAIKPGVWLNQSVRTKVGKMRHTDFQGRDELTQGNQQEVEVEEELELFVEY
jgi:hypothetical protein